MREGAVVVCGCTRPENRVFETQLSGRERLVVPGTRGRLMQGEMEEGGGAEDKGV